MGWVRKGLLLTLLILYGSCAVAAVEDTKLPPYQSGSCPLNVQDVPAPTSEQQFTPEQRLTIFISDLHFGVGKYQKNDQWYWHKEEDFRWDKEFTLFLRLIHEQGKGKTDLILNGDTFELWQSLKQNCRHEENKNLGCAQSEAMGRIRQVIDQHRSELNAIGLFADSGENRVIIVPGNHDAALLFPDVASAVLKEIPHKSDRIRIAKEGYWLSANGLVYAEHGHQIGKEVNCFDLWPRPFVEQEGQNYLQRPWGEQFVQDYYNQYEHIYPIIDNLANEQDGIRYGLKTEGPSGLAKAAGKFFRFFVFDTSWEQFQRSLGRKDGVEPQWDVDHIRQKMGDRFLVESFPKDDPLRVEAETALGRKELGLSLKDLSNVEILEICDKRASLLEEKKTITPCPRKDSDLAAAAQKLLRSRNAVYGEHLEHAYRLLVHAGKTKQRFEVFVYSHTHQADAGFNPFEGKTNWDPLVVNTGAWQRVVTPEQLEEIKQAEGVAQKDVLPTLEPEKLPPCYSVIRVEPYSKRRNLKAVLQYWQQNKDGKWSFEESCKWRPRPNPHSPILE